MLRVATTSSLLVLLVVSLTSCSSVDTFAIVNASNSELEVRYHVRRSGEHLLTVATLPLRPAVLRVEELDQQIPWRDLSDADFELDSQARFVTVKLKPGYVLRVAHLNLRDNPNAELAIDELFLNGVSGQTHLQGRDVQKSFTPGHISQLRYQ